MGCAFLDEWIAQVGLTTAEVDAMHVLLMMRADQLEGCTENSEEASSFRRHSFTVRLLRMVCLSSVNTSTVRV